MPMSKSVKKRLAAQMNIMKPYDTLHDAVCHALNLGRYSKRALVFAKNMAKVECDEGLDHKVYKRIVLSLAYIEDGVELLEKVLQHNTYLREAYKPDIEHSGPTRTRLYYAGGEYGEGSDPKSETPSDQDQEG